MHIIYSPHIIQLSSKNDDSLSDIDYNSRSEVQVFRDVQPYNQCEPFSHGEFSSPEIPLSHLLISKMDEQ